MGKYSIDNKAAEYLQTYAAFEEQLATWDHLFGGTAFDKILEEISDLVESAYEINQEAGLLPENDTFSDAEKFALLVRFDPRGLTVAGLKDVPKKLKKEFQMSEEDFQVWMKEEREALETAFVDMDDLIDSIDGCFRTPEVLEELTHIFTEALDPDDAYYKVLNQFAINLVVNWEDFSGNAKSLVSLALDINEDTDRAALPAMLYDP